MNVRTIAMIGLIAVMGIGAIMLLGDLLSPPAAAARVQVALAAQQIQPYTIITQDMLRATEMTERDASAASAYPIEGAIGLMSTAAIAPGTMIDGVNAKPVEKVRFTEDLGLEIVSFATQVDRGVGGQLRPGHIINLYGNGKKPGGDPYTTLIEPQLWVVAVSAQGRPVTDATPRPNVVTGAYEEEGGSNVQPGTMITVAVDPQKAYHIIDALGAQGLTAYVTLAASQTAFGAATPVNVPTATPGLSLDLSLTATALWLSLQATAPPPPPVTGDGGTQ